MKNTLPHILVLLLMMLFINPSLVLSAVVDREQEVRDAVSAFVTTRTAGMGWDVRVRRVTITGALKLPDGDIDYEVVAPQQWEGWGKISVAVVARQKDRVIRNVPVLLDVEALAATVIAVRQVEQGTVITAADVVLQQREISYNSHRAARAVNELIGKKARTTLRANQPIREDQVEKVPLIKSGQMVTIIAETGVLKISITGKAHSSGAEGDVIRVQNLTSLKEIPARVIDASTVQVAF